MERNTLLWKEQGRMALVAGGIYLVFFLLLAGMECTIDSMKGRLLMWYTEAGILNWPFLIGIPSSLLGTTYVLTIRNPQNYTGFYAGIGMSVLLAIQFYWNGSYDLTLMYLLVFVPFLIASIVSWKNGQSQTNNEHTTPSFLSMSQALIMATIAIGIVLLDYVITSRLHPIESTNETVLQMASGCSIASSLLANLLMIRKKNDTWIFWVLYCLSCLVIFAMTDNLFALLMAIIMLAVNLSGQWAWLKETRAEDYGWASVLLKRWMKR